MSVFLSVAVKVRLPDRHSCLNLYPYVIKFSQAVFVCLSLFLPHSWECNQNMCPVPSRKHEKRRVYYWLQLVSGPVLSIRLPTTVAGVAAWATPWFICLQERLCVLSLIFPRNCAAVWLVVVGRTSSTSRSSRVQRSPCLATPSLLSSRSAACKVAHVNLSVEMSSLGLYHGSGPTFICLTKSVTF